MTRLASPRRARELLPHSIPEEVERLVAGLHKVKATFA